MAITVERLVAEIEANPAGAIAGLTAFEGEMDAAARDRTAHINVDMDRRGLVNAMSGVSGLRNAVGDLGSVMTDVGGGAGTLASGLTAVGGGGDDAGKGLSAAASGGGSFFSSLMSMIPQLATGAAMLGALYAAVTMLPGALAAAAGAAGALVAALAPLVGLLGAIPVGIGAFGGGILALVAGLGDVGKALGQMDNQNVAAAKSTDTLARRQRDLASAYRGLHQAQISVVRANQDLKQAQENMAKAPAEAAKALADQRRAAKQAILSEEEAVLRLKRAQQALNDAQNKTGESGVQMTKAVDAFTGKLVEVGQYSADAVEGANNEKEARLNLKQAELDVANARANSREQQQKLTEMEKKGIKGSDLVTQARRRLVDAEFAVKSAHDGVAAAHDRIAEAQAALKKQVSGTTSALSAYNRAMQALSPTGLQFVRFLHNEFMPAWGEVKKSVQDALLPGIERGLRRLMDMSDLVKKHLSGFGKAMGDSFAKFMGYWDRPQQKHSLDEMFGGKDGKGGLIGVLREATRAAQPLSRIIVAITKAATPMTLTLEKGVVGALNSLADWMESKQGKKSMGHFFMEAAHFAKLWYDVLKPIGGIISGIAKAAKPLATRLMKDLAGYFGDLSDKINSKKGQKNLRHWFMDQLPALREFGRLIRDIGKILFGSSQGGKKSSFYRMMHSLRVDFLPKLSTFLKNADKSNWGTNFVHALTDIADAVDRLQTSNTGKVIEGVATAIVHIGDALKYLHNQGADKNGKQSWWETILFGSPEANRQTHQGFGNWKKIGQDLLDGWDKYINKDFGGALRSTGSWISKRWDSLWSHNKSTTHSGLSDQTKMVHNWGITSEFSKHAKQWSDDISKWWDRTKKGWSGWLRDRTNDVRGWGSAIRDAFGVALGRVEKAFSDMGDWVKQRWDSFLGWIRSHTPNFSGFWDGMKAELKNVLGDLIDMLNSFHINLPKIKIPGTKREIGGGSFGFDIPNPFRQFGGPVEAYKPYVVGEKRPEVFVPSTSGRIMPSVPRPVESTAAGISKEQMERVLAKVLEHAKPNVNVDYQPGESVDPKHLAAEIAWSLR